MSCERLGRIAHDAWVGERTMSLISNNATLGLNGGITGGEGEAVIQSASYPEVPATTVENTTAGASAASAQGGLVINFIADPSVIAKWGTDWQASGFGQALNDAAQFFETHISNPITINIDVGWGEVNGQALGSRSLGQFFAFGNNFLSYSQVRQDLLNDTTSPADATVFANLPSTDPITGTHQYRVCNAQEKALGLLPGNASAPDGAIGFSSSASFDYNTNNVAVPANEYDFVGVAEHEISQAMGRLSLQGSPYTINGVTTDAYGIIDLFRYSSPGVPQETRGQPAYFSLNDGTTDLNNFSTGGDPADWAPSAGNDAFDATSPIGVENAVSSTDVQVWTLSATT